MAFSWLKSGDEAQKREVISTCDQKNNMVVSECYCPNGHSIISEAGVFSGHQGLTLKLRTSEKEGILAISPIIGDHGRNFIDFNQVSGEIVEICCPTCSEPFPVYNECECGAYLVALFTSPKAHFSRCVGICQRIGCLHSELISERDLRLYSRQNCF
jgi:hypothetical protein